MDISLEESSKPLVLTIMPQFLRSRETESQKFFEQPVQKGPPTSSEGYEIPSVSMDNNEERQFFGGYNEIGGHVITRNGHSILSDLKQHSFPDDIKNKADVIFNSMRYRVRRAKIRDQMLFYCVYYAHIELGRDVNPIELGSKFKLSPGEVQQCDSLFSPLQTGYRPPSTYTSALQYLPDYCRNIDLSSDSINEVLELARAVLSKDPTLLQENPQTVAAGLLRYFIVANGVVCDDPYHIAKITGRSNVTIEGMFRRIATIDNN